MSSPPKILISSSVYDKEGLLDQVFATLTGIGYQVWMSDKGTLPVDPKLSNFDNCLAAVEKCDLFLGIISGYYGSGVSVGMNSITHQELSKAIAIDKMRWFLVDHDVLVVRSFVKAIHRLEKSSGQNICSNLQFKQSDPISDMRILEMYDQATRSDVDIKVRKGNWVQPFRNSDDVLRFISTQFGDPEKYITK